MAELIYILCTAIVVLCILAGYLKLKIQKLNKDYKDLLNNYSHQNKQNYSLRNQIIIMQATAVKNIKTIEKLNVQLKFQRNGKK